jgi:hypothetical protein
MTDTTPDWVLEEATVAHNAPSAYPMFHEEHSVCDGASPAEPVPDDVDLPTQSLDPILDVDAGDDGDG